MSLLQCAIAHVDCLPKRGTITTSFGSLPSPSLCSVSFVIFTFHCLFVACFLIHALFLSVNAQSILLVLFSSISYLLFI